MNHFSSIRDLFNTLSRGSKLITEMFDKRKTMYLYEHAAALFDYNEDIIKFLLSKKVIIQNGTYLELEDQFLNFFENILEINEEINTSYVNNNIQEAKDNMKYYLQSNSENERFTYLKHVKSILQRIGKSTLRNIIDLNRNIENTFKVEANYKIKVSKLENHKQKLESIQDLIQQTEHLLSEDEFTFFKIATDEGLKEIQNQLTLNLMESRQNIIETRQQIIDYINQTKYQSEFIEKLKQLKYLRDQYEIKHRTNIKEILVNNNALIFEPKPSYRLKLSIDNLQKDENYWLIKKIRNRYKSAINPIKYAAKDLTILDRKIAIEEENFINLYKVQNDFKQSEQHLFQFILDYQFVREVFFEERVTIYCKLISMFEDEFELTDDFLKCDNIEYAVAYQNKKRKYERT
jgi:hypothetical protein